ncbi:MAG: PEP/pyruvate-binding domain-containing protein, partial [Pseudonocardia sp.]|nr:PEP/pyruvate-binding domain-containing protein [Pseudonocardia sp.]
MSGATPAGMHPLTGLRRTDAPSVGVPAATLGELLAGGLPVPGGVALDTRAHRESMEAAGVAAELSEVYAAALEIVAGSGRGADLRDACDRMQGLVRKAGLSDAVRSSLSRAYSALGIGPEDGPATVAVRSSPTVLAGVRWSRTNVRGHEAVREAIVECWASALSVEAMVRASAAGPSAADLAIGVVVQRMVPAQKAGLASTVDPVSGARDRVVVRAAYGQGEVVITGAVEPDTSVFSVPRLDLLSLRVGHQTHQIVRGRDGHDLTMTLDPERAWGRVLDDDLARAVARLALRAQDRLGGPQEVEWAVVGRQISVLDARPVHTAAASGARVLLGYDASPSARSAIEVGARLLPGSEVTVAHLWTPPFASRPLRRRLLERANTATELAGVWEREGAAEADRVASAGAVLAGAAG